MAMNPNYKTAKAMSSAFMVPSYLLFLLEDALLRRDAVQHTAWAASGGKNFESHYLLLRYILKRTIGFRCVVEHIPSWNGSAQTTKRATLEGVPFEWDRSGNRPYQNSYGITKGEDATRKIWKSLETSGVIFRLRCSSTQLGYLCVVDLPALVRLTLDTMRAVDIFDVNEEREANNHVASDDFLKSIHALSIIDRWFSGPGYGLQCAMPFPYLKTMAGGKARSTYAHYANELIPWRLEGKVESAAKVVQIVDAMYALSDSFLRHTLQCIKEDSPTKGISLRPNDVEDIANKHTRRHIFNSVEFLLTYHNLRKRVEIVDKSGLAIKENGKVIKSWPDCKVDGYGSKINFARIAKAA